MGFVYVSFIESVLFYSIDTTARLLCLLLLLLEAGGALLFTFVLYKLKRAHYTA